MVLAHVLSPEVLDEHLTVRALKSTVGLSHTRPADRREAS